MDHVIPSRITTATVTVAARADKRDVVEDEPTERAIGLGVVSHADERQPRLIRDRRELVRDPQVPTRRVVFGRPWTRHTHPRRPRRELDPVRSWARPVPARSPCRTPAPRHGRRAAHCSTTRPGT
jgi:hypothetical protein